MIRVTCDRGFAHHLKVIDTETGLDLSKHVSDLKLHFDKGRVYATITLYRVELDLTVLPIFQLQGKSDPSIEVCPECGESLIGKPRGCPTHGIF